MPTATEMMLYPMFSMDNVLYVDEAYSHAVERHNQPKAVKEDLQWRNTGLHGRMCY